MRSAFLKAFLATITAATSLGVVHKANAQTPNVCAVFSGYEKTPLDLLQGRFGTLKTYALPPKIQSDLSALTKDNSTDKYGVKYHALIASEQNGNPAFFLLRQSKIGSLELDRYTKDGRGRSFRIDYRNVADSLASKLSLLEGQSFKLFYNINYKELDGLSRRLERDRGLIADTFDKKGLASDKELAQAIEAGISYPHKVFRISDGTSSATSIAIQRKNKEIIYYTNSFFEKWGAGKTESDTLCRPEDRDQVNQHPSFIQPLLFK